MGDLKLLTPTKLAVSVRDVDIDLKYLRIADDEARLVDRMLPES